MPTGHAWSVAGKRSVAAVILVLLPLAPSLLLAPADTFLSATVPGEP